MGDQHPHTADERRTNAQGAIAIRPMTHDCPAPS